MTRFVTNLCVALAATITLSACGVAKTTGKVAALPFKAVYKTGELATKGVVGTGMFAGKTVYGTGKLVGKTVYNTGKGVYYIGSVPVKITDKALDTTTQVLSVTKQVVDISGKAVTITRQIQAAELEAELAGIRGAANVLGVVIEAVT